ncbi:MAG: hypothetical protein PHP54_05615 [Clostridia bacterium]|nr:hypothetical protein [Clostridia bacterium]
MKKNERLFWIVSILVLVTLSILIITYFRGPKNLKVETRDYNNINWNEIHKGK